MNDFAGLNAQEMEHLLFTIETSLKINKRFQFFLWAQGSLQGFIPHETLLCAHGDVSRFSFRYETFARDACEAAFETEFCDPVVGHLPGIVEEWLQSGREPRLIAGAGSDTVHHAYGNMLAHGAKEMQGDAGSFFVFLGTPQPPSARDAYLLELLMPYLHMALHRMLGYERSEGNPNVTVDSGLSHRELQVLRWVKDGKTNHEIGQILSISPLTVKNHVQKILRKLNVSNRAQAVGKGAASRLFAAVAMEAGAKGGGHRGGGAGGL